MLVGILVTVELEQFPRPHIAVTQARTPHVATDGIKQCECIACILLRYGGVYHIAKRLVKHDAGKRGGNCSVAGEHMYIPLY